MPHVAIRLSIALTVDALATRSLLIGCWPPAASVAPKKDRTADKKVEASSNEKPSGSTYTVHAGDTLNSIAAQKLGEKSRYKEIVALNPGLDPHHLTVGRVIKLPAGEERTLVAANLSTKVASDRPHVR